MLEKKIRQEGGGEKEIIIKEKEKHAMKGLPQSFILIYNINALLLFNC